jgi:hypothetical protein
MNSVFYLKRYFFSRSILMSSEIIISFEAAVLFFFVGLPEFFEVP